MEDLILQTTLQVVGSVAVGMGAAYLTAQKTLASLVERVRALEARAEATADQSERLVRLETKIDLLLSGRLTGGDGE